MKNRLAVVTVNYNNSRYSVDYVNNILKLCTNFNVEIVVVDNHSIETERTILKELENVQNVHLIYSKSNIGYFKGLNLGLMILQEELEKFKYIIIGNNDLKYYDGFFDELTAIKVAEDVLVLAPDIITIDGYHQNPHVRSRMGKLRLLKLKIYFSNYYIGTSFHLMTEFFRRKIINKLRNNSNYSPDKEFIYMGIGALYILTDSFFHKFKKLDDSVFLYGEEALLANQVASVNGKILYVPELKVIHFESISTSKLPSRERYIMTKKSYKQYSKYL
jgi:GT2 family glycosyltransferase